MAMRFIVPRFPVPRSPHAPYPSLDDAVLLEESLLLLGEGVDELGVLLVRHELRHQALRAVPFLELGVLQHRLDALLPLGIDLVRQVLGPGDAAELVTTRSMPCSCAVGTSGNCSRRCLV